MKIIILFFILLSMFFIINSLEISEFIVTPTASEAIELHNETGSTVNIGNYYLIIVGVGFEDTTQFPSDNLLSDEYVSYQTADLTNGLSLPNNGAILKLYDDSWNILDSVGYGHLGPAPAPIYNWSASRVNNTGDNALDFNFDSSPTLGSANDAPGVLLGNGSVFLNEIYPDTGTTTQYIELYNNGSTAVDISEWIIICNDDYYVPSSTTLNGNSYFTVYESDFPTYFYLDFNENVYLLNNNGERIDQTGFNSLTNGLSWSVIPNGTRTSYDDYDSLSAIDWKIADKTPDAINSITDTPPSFANQGQTPSAPQPSEQVITYIDITDNSSIATDSMYYRVNSGTWSVIYHDSISGNTYYFNIPGQVENDIIEYYFIAIDDTDNRSVSDTFNYTVKISSGSGYRILFDYTLEETAGNADWIVDLDYPTPSPASPTTETDWQGAISYWGYELDTFGYEVITLPPDSSITYGTASPVDLSNFDVYIMPEPQNQLTLSEKQAIFDFVRNGGGLYMVSDHNASDRNSSGWDSPRIFNDLGAEDSFGMHFDTTGESYNSISDTATYFTGMDSIYAGPFGSAVGGEFIYHLGTTIPSSAQAIEIAPHPSNSSYSMLSVAYFGNGRVAGMGDSSPIDDGTGDPGDDLYDGWTEGVSRVLILNTTWWLSGVGASTMLNEINSSWTIQDNNIILKLNISNYSKYNTIRVYKKTVHEKRYTYIQTIPSEENISIKYPIEDYNIKTFYKITGITTTGKEDFLQLITTFPIKKNITLKNDIIINNIIAFSGIENNTYYTISDKTGRIVQKGITTNKINISNLKKGIYFVNINSQIFKIINIK